MSDSLCLLFKPTFGLRLSNPKVEETNLLLHSAGPSESSCPLGSTTELEEGLKGRIWCAQGWDSLGKAWCRLQPVPGWSFVLLHVFAVSCPRRSPVKHHLCIAHESSPGTLGLRTGQVTEAWDIILSSLQSCSQQSAGPKSQVMETQEPLVIVCFLLVQVPPLHD